MEYSEEHYEELMRRYEVAVQQVANSKVKRVNPFALGLVFCPLLMLICLILAVKFDGQGLGYVAGAMFGIFIGVVGGCYVGKLWWASKREKNTQNLQANANEKAKEVIDYVYGYFCSTFDITRTRLEAELELLSRTYPNILQRSTVTNKYVKDGVRHEDKTISYDFWKSVEHIDTVEELLGKKFKSIAYADSKQDLTLQNLELKNESIAIDNKQKKFWTCQFCGNMNRADDMSCIKCGGIRPSIE